MVTSHNNRLNADCVTGGGADAISPVAQQVSRSVIFQIRSGVTNQ
jgi:hypothetical protein